MMMIGNQGCKRRGDGGIDIGGGRRMGMEEK
jgi:hypothetical protein